MGRRRYQKPSVQRTQRKNKRDEHWWFRARVDVSVGPGQTRRVEKSYFLGLCSEMGKREAEHLRDQILTEAINKPAIVLQSQVIFGRILDEFMEMIQPDIRSHTAKNYGSIIRRHIRPAFGEMRLCDMTPQTCQKWLQSLRATQSRASRLKILTLFRFIWERATDWNYTREMCPLRRASLGPIESGRQKTLPTVEQFRKIVQLLEEPYRSMLLVATFTGMRISEIRGLKRGDAADGVLTVQRSMNSANEVFEVKTAASWRKVPVGHLATIFSSKGPKDELLFPNVVYQTARRRLQEAGKAAGIEYVGFGWHTFRRASVTWGRRAGASQDDSMAQHGHTQGEMNDRYYVEDDLDFNRRATQEATMFEAVMFGGKKGGRA